MRATRLGLWALLCLSFAAHGGTNSWSVKGPFGGNVVDIVYRPNSQAIAYAATHSALYRTSDGGASWSAIKEDFGFSAATDLTTDLAIDPINADGLYLTSRDSGIFHTADGGATFTLIRSVTNSTQDGPAAIAVAANGTRLYYISPAGRFFRSNDAGATWAEATRPFTGRRLVVGSAGPDVVYAVAFGLRKSIDGGASWTDIAPASDVHGFAIVPGTPETLVVSTLSGVFSSIDDGAHWTAGPTMSLGDLAQDPNDPSVLLASDSDNSVWRFAAGTWTKLPGVLDSLFGQSILAVAPGNSQHMLAGTVYGVNLSDDQGATWARSNTGLVANNALAFSTGSGRVYVGTDANTLEYAPDENGWQQFALPARSSLANPLLAVAAVAAHPSNPLSMIFAGVGTGTYSTLDGGVTWAPGPANLFGRDVAQLVRDPVDPNTIYATAPGQPAPQVDDYVFKSVDGGVTFNPASNGLRWVTPANLVIDPHNTQRLFFASGLAPDMPGVFRSLNGGTSWDQVTPFQQQISDVAIDPSDQNRVYSAWSVNDGLRVSDDGGATWAPVVSFTGFGAPLKIVVDPVTPTTLYVLSSLNGVPQGSYFVMRSVDRGQTWERIPNRLPTAWVPQKLTLHPTTPSMLFLGVAWRGVHTLEIAPDLSVAISGHSGLRTVSSSSSFDVAVANKGPYSSTRVQLKITLPAGLQGVTASIAGQSCVVAATSVDCSLPYLRTDTDATAHVQYTPAAAGELPITAVVSANERDPIATNNTATASATVNAVAPPPPPPAPPSSGGGGGGGGGSMGWLFLLSLGVLGSGRRRAGVA